MLAVLFIAALAAAAGGEDVTTSAPVPDIKLASPTNFRYARLSPTQNILGWDWEDATVNISNIEFLTVWCPAESTDEKDCRQKTVLAEYDVTLDQLEANVKYTVNITAEVKAHEDWSPSDPLTDFMTTLAQDYPSPKDVAAQAKPYSESPDPAKLQYLVSWTLPNVSDAFEYLDGYTVMVCTKPDGNDSCQATAVDEGESKVFLLDFWRDYSIKVTARYDLELDRVTERTSEPNVFKSDVGPPEPVEELAVTQESGSARFKLSWKTPKITNGPPESLACTIEVVDNSTNKAVKEITDKAAGDKLEVIVPLDSDKLKDKATYIFHVKLCNKNTNEVPVCGQHSAQSVQFKRPATAGFPGWAIALIVLLILAAIGGGAYYYLKMR